MIPELGNFSLIMSLCMALLLASIPLWGAYQNDPRKMALAGSLAYAQLLFLLIAYICLTSGFISNDFTVRYIAENSSRNLPLIYRMAAVWGAHEGSMLLWVCILGVWTALVALFSKQLSLASRARVLAVLGMVSVGFLWFLLATSNPFLRLFTHVPINGLDLNPLLQDPGLISHPPMLYMGYVGFSVVFAFAIASLIAGKIDTDCLRWCRPWTLAAWCFLTCGITLGSWWAYRELGWGGWWFWDPVENASFLPWLVGTALIHSLFVTEKRNAFRGWMIFLSISAFSLSLLGTFLVRSGVLTSVHAFANDPTRGVFMLAYLSVVVGASLFLYAWRAPKLTREGHFDLISRETLLLANNVLLLVAMLTVLLGTLYPLFIQAMGLGKLSVGRPYFNTVFIPLMSPLLFFMAMGPHARWQSMPAKLLLKRLGFTFLVSVSLAVLLPWVFASHINPYVVLGLGLALWIILATGQYLVKRIKQQGSWRLSSSQYGMVAAHMGVAVTVIGIALSTAYSSQRLLKMAPGDTATLGSYQFYFRNLEDLQGPNYHGVHAYFTISKNGKPITTLDAQKRIYDVTKTPMTHAAIDANIFRDLYIALGTPAEGDAWTLRIYNKPFVRWIWAGGLLMLIGGLLSLANKRFRVPQPSTVKRQEQVA